jgi:YVTN family beta-propeller protein
MHPAGTFMYVANFFSKTLSIINTATHTVTATVPVGEGPFGVAVHPAGTSVYVTNTQGFAPYVKGKGNGSVSVINTVTNAVVATVPVGNAPHGVAVHPAGTFVYVANFGSNSVSVIDTTTYTVTATIKVGDGPVAFGQFIGPGKGQGR